jgi:hypothetical protein
MPKAGRTHSEPELPQLLPIPARPHTSYESQPEFKEFQQFPPAIIQAMSRALGISVEKEAEYHWVIRDTLLALREEGFACVLRGTDLSYVHEASEESVTVHPVVEFHRKLAERLILAGKEHAHRRQDRFFRIQELVFAGCMGETDVRRVTTPAMIEEILQLLGIKPLDEPFLLGRLKVCIEDAYFAMKEAGPHFIRVDNILSPEKLIVQLQIDRVKFLKQISPSGLLYCVECETQLGDVASAVDGDIYCNQCFVATHGSGHRADHPAVFIEQTVCSECEMKSALVRDQDDMDLYCFECFKATHKAGKRLRHCLTLPQTTYCMENEEEEAAYMCVETEEFLSAKSLARIQRGGARRNLTIFGLRKAAYSKKLFADNLERILTIVERYAAEELPMTPWYVFWDDAFNPFWYNFFTREKVRADPFDLANPPESEKDPLDMKEHEQISEALPGATDMIRSHAAQMASKCAVFHVPPPMSVKFKSPAVAAQTDTSALYSSDPLGKH